MSSNPNDPSNNNEIKYNEDDESQNVTYEEIENISESNRIVNEIMNNYDNNLGINSSSQIRNPQIQHINSNINQNGVDENELGLDPNNSNLNNVSGNLNNGNFDNQIDDIYESLTYLINNERQNIKNEKSLLLKNKQKFKTRKSIEIAQLEKEKDEWNENLKIVDSLNVKETDVIDLDIGGNHKVSTTRSTLMKYPNSALSTMFSGRHKLPKHNDRIFIDRDGHAFVNMLNYLRSGKFPIFKDKNEEMAFYDELEFWQISIKEEDTVSKTPIQFDSEWCATTLMLDQNNTLVKKHNLQHGIIFCKLPLDMYNHYIEFKIIMNIPSRGKSHLFIGLVDKSKYKFDNLISTFWKDSPSSYYWDVWNSKLIKTDENGTTIGSVNGYGCQCEEYETKISIKYDYKSRSVIYYKNGISQGVAFKNVQAGLTPSLDIWFESGSVEIMKTHSLQEKLFL